MTRWHFLLVAGAAALSPGCFLLPQNDGSYRGPAVGFAPGAPDPLELPPEKAARTCLATAQTLEQQGHDAEAILEYQRARERDPRLPGVARRLAVLYDRRGDGERARDEYLAALQEQPRDADLLNDVGCFHYQRGDGPMAEQYLRQALAVNPEHPRAWGNLGKALALEGKYEQSCEAFGHVVRPAQAAMNVGILLAKEGKVTEAREVLQRALRLEPDLKAARAVLAGLDSRTSPPEVRLTAE
jgi:Tfp pilus assembly protein PilF